jgi:hypothetical protein
LIAELKDKESEVGEEERRPGCGDLGQRLQKNGGWK